MNRRKVLAAIPLTLASAPLYAAPGWWERLTRRSGEGTLSEGDIGAGLKEALQVGAGRALDSLGSEDGFLGNLDVRIPLPDSLSKVRKALDRFGLGSAFDELEVQMNRAAEQAAPAARSLFSDAISSLTLADVRGILNGGDQAATAYLRTRTEEPLAANMLPIVEQRLEGVGAARSYDKLVGRYNQLPFVSKIDANLSGYVVERGLDGIFVMLGREEAAIRANPLEQSSKLLRRVFGSV